MRDMRESIKEDKFPQFVQKFMQERFKDGNYPGWAVDALNSVGITLAKPES